MSVVRLIVVTRSSGPPASGKLIKEIPVSVASGTSYISRRYCLVLLPLLGLLSFRTVCMQIVETPTPTNIYHLRGTETRTRKCPSS